MSDSVVSGALCNCRLGHVMNFTEAFLGRPLNGMVLHYVPNGNFVCDYEIEIPEDIMEKYIAN